MTEREISLVPVAEQDATVEQLLAALGRALQVVDGLERIVEERAHAIARGHIAAADCAAGIRVAEARVEAERQASLAVELRRRADAADRGRDLALRERDQARARVAELMFAVPVRVGEDAATEAPVTALDAGLTVTGTGGTEA